jgi:hypothetical protein
MSRVPLTVVLALLTLGSGEGGPKGTPINALTAAGKCPVEMTAFSRIAGPRPVFALSRISPLDIHLRYFGDRNKGCSKQTLNFQVLGLF